MERPADLEAARKRAITYLQDLIHYGTAAGQSPHQTASGIADLAFEANNPVKELFTAAYRPKTSSGPPTTDARTVTTALPQCQPASPEKTLKSRPSRSLLRLGRRGSKIGPSESKVPQVPQHPSLPQSTSMAHSEMYGNPPPSTGPSTDQTRKESSWKGVCPRASNSGKGSTKAASMISSFPAVQRSTTKAPPSAQYQCIVCDESLSSKGVCKRHLEDQHVSPKMFECERCQERFTVKAEAKKHCNECGSGIFLYIVVKQEPKRAYASAYTGEVFSSMAKYLDHLLKLSEKTDGRPTCDLQLKLRALLDQPSLQHHVAEISSRIYGSKHAWKNLQWNESVLGKSIEHLEFAAVREDGTMEFGRHGHSQKTQKVGVFLNGLLNAGSMTPANSDQPKSREQESESRPATHATCSSISSRTSNHTLTPTEASSRPPSVISSQNHTNSIANSATNTPSSTSTNITYPMDSDVKGKRHLSDQSRFYVPVRHPPGPPAVPMSVPQTYDMPVEGPHQSLATSSSTTSLPYRLQGGPLQGQAVSEPGPIEQQGHDLTCVQNGTLSDTASESTLISNYQEPQFLDSSTYDYNLWHGQQQFGDYPFAFDNNLNCPVTESGFFMPSNTSMRSSIATDQTYVGHYSEAEQKLANYDAVALHAGAQNGTFLWDEDDYHHDGRRIN